MREDLEAQVQESLDGTLDAAGRERLARELEGDAQARSEYADQLRIHHRLGVTLERTNEAFTASVLREVRLLGDAERFSREVVHQIKQTVPARRRIWEMAAAGMILALAGVALWKGGTRENAPSNGPHVLLVVGQVPLAAGDARVKERLESLGCRVTAKSANEVLPSEAAGKRLIAISSTSHAADVVDIPGELTAKFRDAPVPVLSWEPRLFHDLGLIEGADHQRDWGAMRDQSRVVITDPAHPLAAGLSGRVTVISAPDRITWGRVRSDALKIAALDGDPDRVAIFAYERGASMPGLIAPARRVGLFLFDETGGRLTSEGWALFDAAIRWSLSTK